jgi:hypothetical protein
VIRAPAAQHCVFLERPQARDSLARVENPGVRAADRIDVHARISGDTAHVLHEVQDYSLATQQHARVVSHHRQHLTGMHAHPVKHLRVADDFETGVRLRTGVEASEDFQELRHAAQSRHDHLLPGDDRG